MEPRALVALGLVVHLVLARAELAEVLCGARHDILEQLERDPAEWLSCVGAIPSAVLTQCNTSLPLTLALPIHRVHAGPLWAVKVGRIEVTR